jgi:hypothetical protein
MTKGEWYVPEPFDGDSLTISCDSVPIADMNIERTTKAIEANQEAIVSAVNNTYGKGINPESVGEWKALLQSLADGGDPSLAHINELSRRAKEALTASKLPTNG